MATIQLSCPQGGILDGTPAGQLVTEATGGGAPTGQVDLNIATGTRKDEVLRALLLFEEKILQSSNLP